MFNHAYFRVYNNYLRVYIPWVYIIPLGLILFPWVYNPFGFIILMDNYGHALSNVALWQRLSQYENQPWSNVALWQRSSWYENQSWSIMVQCHIVTRIISIWKSTMVDHVYFRVYNIYIRVYNIYLRVYIPWVYNIYPLVLILFPWVL